MTRYADERIPLVKNTTPRKKRAKKRLVTLLILFFIIVLSVVFFRSPYSKVSEIQVYGNMLYTKEQILAAANVTVGMQFINVWNSDVKEGIGTLKGIKEVTISRDFPGVIRLNIQEYRRVALYVNGQKPTYLLENGSLLEPPAQAVLLDRPVIQLWSKDNEKTLVSLAEALASMPSGILYEVSDISLTPTKFDDERLTLHMRDGNEVRTNLTHLKKKLPWYPAIVQEVPKEKNGVVHLFEVSWFEDYETYKKNSLPATNNQSTSPTNQEGTGTNDSDASTQNPDTESSSQTQGEAGQTGASGQADQGNQNSGQSQSPTDENNPN
ncbi:cell division protein FtsQ/DivIB [Brevibacillus daliensis]|uniref:cell division protein FtsQ/DivIB n=1 Tax=Brevibacillus daliensis TaxID=2892995 RepID=UPI001E5C4937|nr:FtsQ-type POTRA domain-containing protein [Brevibacillus daliensis]